MMLSLLGYLSNFLDIAAAQAGDADDDSSLVVAKGDNACAIAHAQADRIIANALVKALRDDADKIDAASVCGIAILQAFGATCTLMRSLDPHPSVAQALAKACALHASIIYYG